MYVHDLSEKYSVRPMTDADIPQMLSLCRGNPLYYQYCPPFVTAQSLAEDLRALPPKKTMDDKYFAGYFDGERLVALLDLILGFPDEHTAFIGFFMTAASVQRGGVGSAIIAQLCAFLKSQGFQSVRLGWIKGNRQSESFWHKNGFIETGVESVQERYTVTIAQKEL